MPFVSLLLIIPSPRYHFLRLGHHSWRYDSGFLTWVHLLSNTILSHCFQLFLWFLSWDVSPLLCLNIFITDCWAEGWDGGDSWKETEKMSIQSKRYELALFFPWPNMLQRKFVQANLMEIYENRSFFPFYSISLEPTNLRARLYMYAEN